MHGSVTDEEWEIFREVYQYFAAHSDPPANQDIDAVTWWTNAATDIGVVDNKWPEHKLMRSLLMAVYEYIEYKAKEKTKEMDEFVPEQ